MLDSDIGDFNCPMDILYRLIDKEVIDLRKNKNWLTYWIKFSGANVK